MAKKIKAPGPRHERGTNPIPGARPARADLGRWWLLLAVVAVALVGSGAVLVRQRQASRLRQSLPARPELGPTRTEFRQRLIQAEAQARAASGPEALEGVAALGRLYHASGFNSEAEACWQILQAAQPQEARWCYYRADLRRLAADADGLKTLLEQTVQRAPEYGPAWLELAELGFKHGQLDPAERAYRRRLSLIPGDRYALLGLARVTLARGQRAEGRRQLDELARQAPDFSSVHNVYAELLGQDGDVVGAANQRWFGTVAGRFRAADDPWKDELREWCYDPAQLMVWGGIEQQTKRGDRGKSLFERAIQLAPENPRGYESLGAWYLEAGETVKAAELLEHGSRLPLAPELLFVSLSTAYRTLHQPAEALRAADQGLALMPDSADISTARGLALEESGRPLEAMEAYRVASRLAPSAADPIATLGLALLRQGRKAEAYPYLLRAVELQPMFPKAVTMLARLALEEGNLKVAAQYIFPYFEQYPGLGTARELMAKYYLRSAIDAAQKNDVRGAEESCRKGLAIVPEAAELNGFLGVQCLQQHRLPEALEALQKSRRLQPADLRVLVYLAQVYAELGRFSDARSTLAEGEKQARQRGDAATAAQCAGLLATLPE